jgi:hypothetical protein
MKFPRWLSVTCTIALAATTAWGIRFDAELAGAVRDVAARLRPILGKVPGKIPLAVRADRSSRKAAAQSRRDEALPPSRLAARGRAWADIGLGKETDPAELYLSLAEDLPELVFSADRTQLLVGPDRLTDSDFGGESGNAAGADLLFATGVRPDEPAVAHMMTHVAQDDRGAPPGLRETTDATLASSAWREGEANLVAMLLLYGGLGMEGEVVQGRIAPREYRGGDLTPRNDSHSPVTGRLMDFVYAEGFQAAAARVRSGGWALLRESAAAEPQTRAILHLEDSFAAPEAVPAPVLSLPDGFSLVDRDRIGEYGIGVLVAERVGKENLGWIAADGWTGDGLFRWENPTQERGVTLWVTRWSAGKEATDFRYAMGRFYGTEDTGVDGSGTGTASAEGVRRLGDRVVRIAQRGTEVRIRVAPADLDEGLGTVSQEPMPNLPRN